MKSLVNLAAALCGMLSLSGLAGSAFAQTLPTLYSWTSTGPIISAKSDATHNIIAVKDPSAVLFNGRRVIYASDVNSAGNYNMEYLNVAADWSDASTATPYFMDNTPGFSGYHTAPQIFYFAPQKKWYLIFQSPQPQYSTNSDPTQPQNWTQPKNFYASQPSSVSNWIDFWVICDTANCYLFFNGDNGNFYRASTPIGNFPNGFNTPVIVDSSTQFNMFEADNVYTIEGSGGYLANIECLGPNGQRYFRTLWASNLGGVWSSLGDTDNFSTPFLGQDNVTFNTGVSAWTTSFSSGGLLIDGNDQTDSVNLDNLQFLYQGASPSAYSSDPYNMIPWQLALATSKANTGGTGSRCTVDYTITPQSSSTFGATIKIINNGSTSLSGWSLTWSFANGQTVASSWDGTVSQSGANVTVGEQAGQTWEDIPAGGSYTGFGFNGTWNGTTNAVPTGFSLNGTACTVN